MLSRYCVQIVVVFSNISVASVQYWIKSRTWIFSHLLENSCPLGFPFILFLFYAVLSVCVPFPFGVWGRMWNSIVSVFSSTLIRYQIPLFCLNWQPVLDRQHKCIPALFILFFIFLMFSHLVVPRAANTFTLFWPLAPQLGIFFRLNKSWDKNSVHCLTNWALQIDDLDGMYLLAILMISY